MSDYKKKLLELFPNWSLVVVLKIAEKEEWVEIKEAIENFLRGNIDNALKNLML